MNIRFHNIQWDTSGDDSEQVDVGLPTEVTLEVDDDLDVSTEGADVLSDKYGFCVFGFDYTKIMQAKDVEIGQKFTRGAPEGVYTRIDATGITVSWPIGVTPQHVWAIDESFLIHTIHPDNSVEIV